MSKANSKEMSPTNCGTSFCYNGPGGTTCECKENTTTSFPQCFPPNPCLGDDGKCKPANADGSCTITQR